MSFRTCVLCRCGCGNHPSECNRDFLNKYDNSYQGQVNRLVERLDIVHRDQQKSAKSPSTLQPAIDIIPPSPVDNLVQISEALEKRVNDLERLIIYMEGQIIDLELHVKNLQIECNSKQDVMRVRGPPDDAEHGSFLDAERGMTYEL